MSNKTRIVTGRCYSTEWCPGCGARLYDRDVYYNNSICPHCGRKGSSAIICDYITKVYRDVTTQKLVWFGLDSGGKQFTLNTN